MNNRNKISIGASGEYFVAAELERRGFTVALPTANTEAFDILAIDRKTHKQFAIQVKTQTFKVKKQSWMVGIKSQKMTSKNVFYIFVRIIDFKEPEYFIVPGKTVAEVTEKEYQNWLVTPGRKGQNHKENDVRKFPVDESKYMNKWELLK